MVKVASELVTVHEEQLENADEGVDARKLLGTDHVIIVLEAETLADRLGVGFED